MEWSMEDESTAVRESTQSIRRFQTTDGRECEGIKKTRLHNDG